MPQIKKEVVTRITDMIHDEETRLRNKLRDGAWAINKHKVVMDKLVFEQTVMKRELAELTKLTSDIKNRK